MGKADQIRAMREANYERDQRRSGATTQFDQPKPEAKIDDGNGRTQHAGVGTVDNAGDSASDKTAQKLAKPDAFNRTEYQRGYMRKWRAKRTARLKELEAMLKAKEMLD